MNAGNVETNPMMRYRVLLGAVVVQLILGTVYGYSIFWQPLQAEIFPAVYTQAQAIDLPAEQTEGAVIVADAAAAKKQKNLYQNQLKYAFAICILSFAVVMVIAGRVQDITGPRLPAVIGAVLMGVGFLLASFMHSPIVFYIGHAAFAGAVLIVLLMLQHAVLGKLDAEQTPVVRYVPMGLTATVIVAAVMLGDQYVGKAGEMDELFVLWGTIGFLAGAGIGFAYVCPIAALVKWFPKHKGLVSGLAVAGFGFGAYLFKGQTLGAFGYIEQHGIRSFFVIHALICFVGVSIGAWLLCNPPGITPGVPPGVPPGVSPGATKKITADSTWQDTLKRPSFYVLWLMFFSGAMAGLMVIGIVKPFAGEQLIQAARAGGSLLDASQTTDLLAQGAEAVGYLAIFNAVGRIVWGFVSDRIGRTTAFVAMFVFQAIMLFSLIGMKTPLSLATAASIVGFNFGGNFALFPSATADLFGAKNLGANYGWVFTSYGVAGVTGIWLGNVAREQTGSYAVAFSIAAALCLVSALLAVVLAIVQRRSAPVEMR